MVSLSSFGADKEAKEVTVSGEGKCAKCSLHQVDKCQNAIETTENGQKVTYYLTKNKVSDAFHDNICQEAHKVKATGKVHEENGKKMLTPSKIDLVKE